jgi:hypothetical protein
MKNMPKKSRKKAQDRNALSEDALQPWFLPRALSRKIRGMVPNDYWRKMRYYFDDYGCLRCERKSLPYGINGLCRVCYKLVLHRIGFALGSRKKAGVKPQYSAQQLRRIAYAHELLRDLK